MAMLGLAWVANWYAVKAWASRRLRLTRCHERGPGEGLFGQLPLSEGAVLSGDHLPLVCAACSGVRWGGGPAGLAGVSVVDRADDHVDAAASSRGARCHLRSARGCGCGPAPLDVAFGGGWWTDGSAIPGR